MALVRIYAAVLAALLAVPPLTGAAAPFTVRLGMERIALDALTGFSDTTDLASPRLQDLAQTLTSPSNRVLLFALTDGDLQRFKAKHALPTWDDTVAALLAYVPLSEVPS